MSYSSRGQVGAISANTVSRRREHAARASAREAVGLLPQHRELIEASAIWPDVAEARGYRSVTEKRELNGLFGPVQQRVPALLIPLHDVYGELRAYQLRPDQPRVTDGRVVKYETPRGLKMMLDCPPAPFEHVRNPAGQPMGYRRRP